MMLRKCFGVLPLGVLSLSLLTSFAAPQNRPVPPFRADRVRCANLIYAGNHTSRCFSDRFLVRLREQTSIPVEPGFARIRLDGPELASFPFAVMSGEGTFRFSDRERVRLRRYLTGGGFLVASAGCSDRRWAVAFRTEFARLFPGSKLQTLPLSHPVFRTVYRIDTLATLHALPGKPPARIEGYEYEGRLVLLFSPDGLNDTAHTDNCCCCSGDEIERAEFINVNALAYAILR